MLARLNDTQIDYLNFRCLARTNEIFAPLRFLEELYEHDAFQEYAVYRFSTLPHYQTMNWSKVALEE